jgi:hypothetical protein
VAAAWPRFGNDASVAQESTGNRQTCGTKATASLPQRRTSVQALEKLQVFADNGINGIVAFTTQYWRVIARFSIGNTQ